MLKNGLVLAAAIERLFYRYWVGQNKRYGDSYVDKWIEGWILREEPMTLTAVEVDLDGDPERIFPEPRNCRAWVRYPTKAVLVQATAIAWNSRAVKIRFLEPAIKTEREAWVWTNAVTPEPAGEHHP